MNCWYLQQQDLLYRTVTFPQCLLAPSLTARSVLKSDRVLDSVGFQRLTTIHIIHIRQISGAAGGTCTALAAGTAAGDAAGDVAILDVYTVGGGGSIQPGTQ